MLFNILRSSWLLFGNKYQFFGATGDLKVTAYPKPITIKPEFKICDQGKKLLTIVRGTDLIDATDNYEVFDADGIKMGSIGQNSADYITIFDKTKNRIGSIGLEVVEDKNRSGYQTFIYGNKVLRFPISYMDKQVGLVSTKMKKSSYSLDIQPVFLQEIGEGFCFSIVLILLHIIHKSR